MSMDAVICYRENGTENVRGTYVNSGLSKDIGGVLRNQFGRSRGSLVEWVENQRRGAYDTHECLDHDDNCMNEAQILCSGADQLLYIEDDGSITDITKRAWKNKSIPQR